MFQFEPSEKNWWKTKRSTSVVIDENGVLSCTYHDTVIVRAFPDGRIELNTGLERGGWARTPSGKDGKMAPGSATTRERMNQVSAYHGLGFSVSQTNWQWFISFDGRGEFMPDTGKFCFERDKTKAVIQRLQGDSLKYRQAQYA